ncbi:hypothetical protein LPJ56_006985, partial [Coemansia sp. RSA 2599]
MSFNLTAPVERAETRYAVSEIDDQGTAVLSAPATVRDKLTQQIGQLWQTHANFTGLDQPEHSDGDADQDAADTETQPTLASSSVGGSGSSLESAENELDAYAVRAKVHDALTLAQSEIQ